MEGTCSLISDIFKRKGMLVSIPFAFEYSS